VQRSPPLRARTHICWNSEHSVYIYVYYIYIHIYIYIYIIMDSHARF
jgi:hypothetical protein